MTKYVRLNEALTEWASAIHTNKPRNVARHSDEKLAEFGWYPVVEHHESLPDNELYSHVRDRWELLDGKVHVYFVPEMVSVEARQSIISRRCTEHRDTLLVGGLTFAGLSFDTRKETLLRVLGKWTNAQLDPSVTSYWIAEDNTTIFLNNENLRKFGMAFGMLEEQVMMYARQLKDTVEASESPELIDIYANWPSNEFYPDVELTL